MLHLCQTGAEASRGLIKLNENEQTKDGYAEVVRPG